MYLHLVLLVISEPNCSQDRLAYSNLLTEFKSSKLRRFAGVVDVELTMRELLMA